MSSFIIFITQFYSYVGVTVIWEGIAILVLNLLVSSDCTIVNRAADPSNDEPVPMILSLSNSANVSPFISLSSYIILLFSPSAPPLIILEPSSNKWPEPMPDSNAICIPSLNVLNASLSIVP